MNPNSINLPTYVQLPLTLSFGRIEDYICDRLAEWVTCPVTGVDYRIERIDEQFFARIISATVEDD